MSTGIRAGRAFVELGVRSQKFQAQLNKASSRLRSFGAQVGKIGVGLTAAGAALAAPLLKSLKTFSDFGEIIQKTGIRTGLTAEAISEMAFALDRSGTSLADFENSFRRMQRNIVAFGEGSKVASKGFERLGITVADLQGLSPDQQFQLIAKAVGSIEDASLQTAAAFDIFGRAGTRLIPLMESDIAGLRAEANRLGLTMSQEAADNAAALTDAAGTLGDVFKDVQKEIANALAPQLLKLAAFLTDVGVKIALVIEKNAAFVRRFAAVAAVVFGVGTALTLVAGVIAGFGFVAAGIASAIGAIVAVVSAVSTAFAFLITPVGAALAAFAALGGGIAFLGVRFLRFTQEGQAIVGFITGTFSEAFRGMGDAIAEGNIALAARVAMSALRRIWVTGTARVQMAWLGFTFSIRDIFDKMVTSVLRVLAGFLNKVGQIINQAANLVSKVPGLGKISEKLRGAGGRLSALGGGIEEAARERQDKRQKDFVKRMQELQRTIDKTNEVFRDNVTEARKGRMVTEQSNTAAAVVARAVGAGAGAAGGIRGTFSARAAAQFGAGSGGVLKVTSDDVKRQTRILQRIKQVIEREGRKPPPPLLAI